MTQHIHVHTEKRGSCLGTFFKIVGVLIMIIVLVNVCPILFLVGLQ